MKHIIFTIYDSKSETYCAPYYAPTEAAGIRTFAMLCNQQEHTFFLNPEDYTLFSIGEFEDQTSNMFVGKEAEHSKSLGRAIDFKKQMAMEFEKPN